MQNDLTIPDLEAQLDNFDAAVRATALAELVRRWQAGELNLPPQRDVANMHCHTFFSYNAYGYSPSGLAWLARKEGYRLMGIVDFDVLDAVDEFLNACDLVGVRGSAGSETRVFVPEFATREINSPGEPGIDYHMGIGFTSSSVPPEAAGILADMRGRARQRNLDIIQRVNAFLDPVTIDYEADVLPLTPAGTATERHIVLAYVQAAEHTVPDVAAYWAGILGIDPAEAAALLAKPAAFQNLVRTKLMKRGGVGYVEPSHDAYPRVDEFHRLITACGALPCAAWLDGMSAGEQAMEELLGLLVDQGAVALNIIPDRNWNLADPDLRARKLSKLYEVVQLAQALDLPLNVGTEMNSPGNKLVDDFDAPELEPIRQAFLDGAHFIYGHTVMQRTLGLGYQSSWAQDNLPTRRARNDFYTKVGQFVLPGSEGAALLRELDKNVAPAEMLAQLS